MPCIDRLQELRDRENLKAGKTIDERATIIYYTQFYNSKIHSKLRKWLIIKLIKFQLRFKK